MGGISALRSAKDLVSGFVAGIGVGGRGGPGENDAGELGAGDPGERGLVLIFAADLEKVEEVGCRGVDGDEVFGGFGGWGCGEGGDGEGGGSLGNGGVSVYTILRRGRGIERGRVRRRIL